MIEIKCTEAQKEILAEILELSDKCFFEENVCEVIDCGDCIERNIKWDIQPKPLKPCPCCGGEAAYETYENNTYAYCKNCHLQTITYESETQAAKVWNRRVTS